MLEIVVVAVVDMKVQKRMGVTNIMENVMKKESVVALDMKKESMRENMNMGMGMVAMNTSGSSLAVVANMDATSMNMVAVAVSS